MQSLKSVSQVQFSGLTDVSHKSTNSLQFPENTRLVPAEISDISQVDTLFSFVSYDDYIVSFLQPYVANSEIFSPSGFRAVLSHTRSALRLQADSNPLLAKKFGRLAALLDKEQQLFDLLQLYRSALVQG
jgi:hypothetical protein